MQRALWPGGCVSGKFSTVSSHAIRREDIDLDTLADMISTVVEGGIIMSKALQQPKLLAEQVMLFRSYIKLLFLPPAAAAAE